MNAKMPELKRCFESAGLTHVMTVLSSGNVVFDSRSTSEASLEKKIEAAMQASLGRNFYTIVRSTDFLGHLVKTDPHQGCFAPERAKRVVSFLRRPGVPKLALPIESEGAQILRVVGREIFTAYVPNAKGPVFMKLIEKNFGTGVTTRTWETVKKCAAA